MSVSRFSLLPLLGSFLLTVPVAGSGQGDRALDRLVADPAVFGMSPGQFEKEFKAVGFEWLSQQKMQARAVPGYDAKRKLTLFDAAFEPVEALVTFKNGKLSGATISVYTRGDSREKMTREKFEDLEGELKGKVTKLMGERGRERDARGAVRGADGWMWMNEKVAILMESSSHRIANAYSYSSRKQFRAEFLRLRVAPPAQPRIGTAARTARPRVNADDLRSRVKKEENGDVWIAGVPMVDQGMKGYCVVASCERVFRYYGMEVDQHELAQVAESSAAMGTDPEKMVDALQKLQLRFKVRMREYVSADYRDFERDIERYNRAAKRKGLRTFDTKNFIFHWGILGVMDKDVLREVRCRGVGYKKFQEKVKESVEKGIPLLWTLQLGVYPEQGTETPQGGGGHMRLITGYNEKTGEVIFSDSWGAGHMKKRMKIDDAYTVTLGLSMLEPSQM